MFSTKYLFRILAVGFIAYVVIFEAHFLGGDKHQTARGDKPAEFVVKQAGEGREAACGDNVTVSLRLTEPAQETQQFSFVLGGGEIAKEIEQAFLGVKAGSTGEVQVNTKTISPDFKRMLPEAANMETLVFDATLTEATPRFQLPAVFQVFEGKPGAGQLYDCGDRVPLTYTISDPEGNVLVADESVELQLGLLKEPLLEAALLKLRSLRAGTSFTALLPQEVMNSELSGLKTYPLVLVDGEIK